MGVLQKLFCRHIYEDTGKICTFMTFHNSVEILKVYKCMRCGKEVRLDHWGREYKP